jgi:hypothetical protein
MKFYFTEEKFLLATFLQCFQRSVLSQSRIAEGEHSVLLSFQAQFSQKYSGFYLDRGQIDL